MTNPDKIDEDSERRDRPENQPRVCLILAEQILDLFRQTGATAKESRTALDLARRMVMDDILG